MTRQQSSRFTRGVQNQKTQASSNFCKTTPSPSVTSTPRIQGLHCSFRDFDPSHSSCSLSLSSSLSLSLSPLPLFLPLFSLSLPSPSSRSPLSPRELHKFGKRVVVVAGFGTGGVFGRVNGSVKKLQFRDLALH